MCKMLPFGLDPCISNCITWEKIPGKNWRQGGMHECCLCVNFCGFHNLSIFWLCKLTMLYNGAATNGVEKAACFFVIHCHDELTSIHVQCLSDVSIKAPVVALRFTASKTYSYKQGVPYHIILAYWLSLHIHFRFARVPDHWMQMR